MNIESIQQRAREAAKRITFTETCCEVATRVIADALTAQQAEDLQAHGADDVEECDLCKQLTEERDALARQVEELTKDKVMLDWLSADEGFAVVTNITAEEFLRRGHTKVTNFTLREAITSAMKGNTHE